MLRTILSASLLLLVPAIAHADPEAAVDQPLPSHRLTFLAGFLTPTGEVGLEYAQDVAPNIELSAAFGVGFTGPQVSVMPRVHGGSRRVQWSLGVGASGGSLYEGCLSFGEPCTTPDAPPLGLWANAEAGVQFTNKSGTTLRLYAGAGKLVGKSRDCADGNSCGVDGPLPYAGLAIGEVF